MATLLLLALVRPGHGDDASGRARGALDLPDRIAHGRPVLGPPIVHWIPAYSQAAPVSYEFVWPTGEPTPLYRGLGVSVPGVVPPVSSLQPPASLGPALSRPALAGGLIVWPRVLPAGEWESDVRPQAVRVARLVRRALQKLAREDGAVLSALGLSRSEAAAATAPGPFGVVVTFALSTGETERGWRVSGVAPLDEDHRLSARSAFGRVPLPGAARPWTEAPPAAWTIPVGPLASRLSFALGALRDALDPGLAAPLPRLRPLADAQGRLDRSLFIELFRGEEKGLYDRPQWPGVRVFERQHGRLALRESFDGRRAQEASMRAMARAILREPGRYLVLTGPAPTLAGGGSMVYGQQVVLSEDAVFVPEGGLSWGATDPGPRSGMGGAVGGTQEAWTAVVDGAPAVARPVFGAPPADLALACEAARHVSERRTMEWIRRLDGEEEWPGGEGRTAVRFTQRSPRLPGCQIGELVDRLEAYHRTLGLTVERQPTWFGGRRYDNLIVSIPGRMGDWVLMADHTDTAVAEDTATGGGPGAEALWRAAPGADDNGSGTAALLEAARVLAVLTARGRRPLGRGVRLVHLVNEEFPADCAGARAYVVRALARREPIRGLVLLDMVGHDPLCDSVFQLSVGEHPRSMELAGAALDALGELGRRGLDPAGLVPRLRGRFDRSSYLYNTDGVIFSDVGYPVVLFNEHLNREHGLGRRGYHDLEDTTAHIRPEYVTAMARLALATVVLLAGR